MFAAPPALSANVLVCERVWNWYEVDVASDETLNVPARFVVPPWLVSCGLNCVVETVIVEPSRRCTPVAPAAAAAVRMRSVYAFVNIISSS